jgi:hypothetical protein
MENEQSVRAVASYFDEILSGNQQRIREGVCETHYHLDHHHITSPSGRVLASYILALCLSLPLPICIAEAGLRSIEQNAGFSQALMSLLGAQYIADFTRLQAAIYFKNFIRRFWRVVCERDLPHCDGDASTLLDPPMFRPLTSKFCFRTMVRRFSLRRNESRSRDRSWQRCSRSKHRSASNLLNR